MSTSDSSSGSELPRAVVQKDDRPEDPEATWLRDVYRPHAVNLTVRAVVVGMLIGVVMCVSNLYVFFKTGWSMGVTITAAILGWAAFKVLVAARIMKTPLGDLENNALTTVASGAGSRRSGWVAAPVTITERREDSTWVCIQPIVPFQSRTWRHASNSATISNGMSRLV